MADLKLNELEQVTSVSKLVGLDASGNSKSIAVDALPHPNAAAGTLSGILTNGKWYRLANGTSGAKISSAMFVIGKDYGYGTALAKAFFVSASGYTNENTALVRVDAGGVTSEMCNVRLLKAASESLPYYLDIYIKTANENIYYVSYCCNIGFTWQSPAEVSADVPEGYHTVTLEA